MGRAMIAVSVWWVVGGLVEVGVNCGEYRTMT